MTPIFLLRFFLPVCPEVHSEKSIEKRQKTCIIFHVKEVWIFSPNRKGENPMKKTWFVLLLIFLLALLPAAAPAEELEWEEIVPASPEEKLELQPILQYMPSIRPMQGTGLVVVESKEDNTFGVFSSEGREVIPFGLSAVNTLSNGFLSAAKDTGDVNCLAIYTADGTKVSGFSYGVVTVYGSRWAAGIVLADAPEGEKDFTVKNADYIIGRCDLYFVSEEGASLVSSLDRDQFAFARQHGDYISIQNRAGETTAYDRQFQPVLTNLYDVKAAYFGMENNQIVNNITHEAIASGYIEVTEADLPSRMLLTASTVGADGVQVQAVLDTDGNVLMPAEYTVVAMGDPYVVVTDGSGLMGLYSLSDKRLTVPCAYTAILTCATSVDPYVNNGAICVEKDGMCGFVDAATGEVTCPLEYNSRIVKLYGCSMVLDTEKGYILIAADGTRTELYEYTEIPASNGDGTLLAARKDGYYGLIDWHGNEMLPFIHKNVITLTYDSKALIRTSTGLELDAIIGR